MTASCSCWNSTATSSRASIRKAVKGVVTADKSEITNIVTQPNPETGGWRLSFQCSVKDQSAIELRAVLVAER